MAAGASVRANFEGGFKYNLQKDEDESSLEDLEETLKERDMRQRAGTEEWEKTFSWQEFEGLGLDGL